MGQAVLVDDGDGGHELAVFVLPASHGTGVGTHLVEGLLTAGRDRSVNTDWLLVERDNRPAVTL